jgi:hypothetical protein
VVKREEFEEFKEFKEFREFREFREIRRDEFLLVRSRWYTERDSSCTG